MPGICQILLTLNTDDIQRMEAPSKALHEKRQAWINANHDKPTGDLLPWVQKVANEPGSGLTNRQRREWVRKERRFLQRPIYELYVQQLIEFFGGESPSRLSSSVQVCSFNSRIRVSEDKIPPSAMSPESYSWIVAIIAPASSVLIASIFLYGALFSRFRLAFGLISLGAVFYLLEQLYWLAVKLQSSLGISLLTKETFRTLFPVQAVSLFLGLATALIGDAILVWQLTAVHRND